MLHEAYHASPFMGMEILQKTSKIGIVSTYGMKYFCNVENYINEDMKTQQHNNKTIGARLLDEEPVGMTVQVVRVMGDGAFRQRLLEMGFVRGAQVTVLKTKGNKLMR